MAQVVEVKVPDIGDFEDVPVIELLVAAGDTVEEESALIVLESDKATMEVPSPVAGVVKELKVAVGDAVSEGTVVILVESEGAPPDEDEPPADEPSATPATPPTEEPGLLPDADDIYASPAVRRKARAEGIDLRSIQGSGRSGRITMEDLSSGGTGGVHADGIRARSPSGMDPSGPDVSPEVTERVPLSRIKKISGPRLTQSWQQIPHVTQHDEADITDLEAFRKQLNAEQTDVKVTMVALLMKACVASLQAHPAVNASLDGDDLILKRFYNLGFAADTPNGLLVPVIKDVDRKGLLAIAGELSDLSARARDGKLKPDEMRDATFTISSLGGIGGTFFTPIINQPEVAILGVSKAAMKPVFDGAQFVPRLLVPLSLSYDHRVVDGALAARFTTHLGRTLADLRRVLL